MQEATLELRPRTSIQVDEGDITDSQYDQFERRLAVATSTGHLHLYRKEEQSYQLETSFKVAEGHIMSVAWGAGCYGELLAVGTFRKRVSVWTVQGGKWIQISWFQGHDAPIRQVAWSDPIFGCQVFACSDDGNFSVLKIVKDEWKGQLIKAHNGTVNCISPQRLPLLVEESCQNLIVTGGSDSLLKVWREGASEESLVGRLFCELDEQPFELAFEFRASSPIQQVLWRKACFGSKSIELLYSCMDGSLMLLELNTNFSLHVSSKIAQLGDPIATLSESHTGTVLLTTVSGQCHYFTKQKLIPLTLSIT